MSRQQNYEMLYRAQNYAEAKSTCKKVHVGSRIVTTDLMEINGCNRGIERSCVLQGCHRVEKYGENSKIHRLPSDCVAIHSEVDAISKAARNGFSLDDAVIFVTRYPCESCARAIITSGIRKVVYGRKESISDMTKSMFDVAGVEVVHESDWLCEDDNS